MARNVNAIQADAARVDREKTNSQYITAFMYEF